MHIFLHLFMTRPVRACNKLALNQRIHHTFHYDLCPCSPSLFSIIHTLCVVATLLSDPNVPALRPCNMMTSTNLFTVRHGLRRDHKEYIPSCPPNCLRRVTTARLGRSLVNICTT